jgi:hypothetical protein
MNWAEPANTTMERAMVSTRESPARDRKRPEYDSEGHGAHDEGKMSLAPARNALFRKEFIRHYDKFFRSRLARRCSHDRRERA